MQHRRSIMSENTWTCWNDAHSWSTCLSIILNGQNCTKIKYQQRAAQTLEAPWNAPIWPTHEFLLFTLDETRRDPPYPMWSPISTVSEEITISISTPNHSNYEHRSGETPGLCYSTHCSREPHVNPQHSTETENKLYIHVPTEEIHSSPLRHRPTNPARREGRREGGLSSQLPPLMHLHPQQCLMLTGSNSN